MDSTVIVAVVSIVVTGLLSPVLTAAVAERRGERQRARRRFDELQSVVNSASEQMIRGWWGYSVVVFAWRRGLDPSESDSKKALERFELEWEETRVVSARLAIRLGREHPVHTTFRELGHFYASLRDLADIFEKGEPIAEFEERLNDVMQEFKERQREFLDAAHLLIAGAHPDQWGQREEF